jgi:hypothetical protein
MTCNWALLVVNNLILWSSSLRRWLQLFWQVLCDGEAVDRSRHYARAKMKLEGGDGESCTLCDITHTTLCNITRHTSVVRTGPN